MVDWYYVLEGNKVGPIKENFLRELFIQGELDDSVLIWSSGLPTWIFAKNSIFKDCFIFNQEKKSTNREEIPDFQHLETIYYLLIGPDRGRSDHKILGPFKEKDIIQFFDDKRINGKTFFCTNKKKVWASFEESVYFAKKFHLNGDEALDGRQDNHPHVLKKENRSFDRHPFVGRIFFHNRKDVLEGLCDDLSLGGVKILADITSYHFQEGDIFDFNIHQIKEQNSLSFTGKAKIIRLLPASSGLALQFIDENPEREELILSLSHNEGAI